ncbi:TetR family transcriptional regulator [Methanobacterium sp. MB1]|jgi:AcrR family transcriptional regulator|uniref:TetR/AcrR family transcriptional regulator n=1 Tax=Methanobacterium sp. TaxID=2164 RepID=UPI0003C96638|nr:TetR/AcrR family transcriptional regulator [Methanobacterium sp.]CDG65874.1 TetR family transcriptional regulator [Methanobacterium sp. MB1]
MKKEHSVQETKPTKERIFDVALELFSEKGFDAVSVREIARKVGIRESSIYNHYKNKEDILDTIIDHFVSKLHSSGFSKEEEAILLDQDPETYLQEGARLYLEQINTPEMEKIWRLVSIETYHNEKIREFFKKELLEAPLNIWENIFQMMIEKKMIKPLNPRTLAHEYFSFAIYLFFEYYFLKYDEGYDSFSDLALEKIAKHNEFFLEAIKI